MRNYLKISYFLVSFFLCFNLVHAAEKTNLLKTDWSFKGLFGKFDRASLQRGYQVYTEVCASCHSMKYLSYRNLMEEGGPEFSESQAKLIAGSFEIKDGPNADGEMFTRPGKLSDKFVMPKPLSDGLVEYADGTISTEEQMAKDVTTFMMWSAEPHLEARHKMGFKVIIYLIILTILVYFSMKRVWSRIEPKV